MPRALAIVIASLVAACDGCRKTPAAQADASVDGGRYGRVPVDPDFAAMLPEPPAGMTACHPLDVSRVVADEAALRRDAWSAKARSAESPHRVAQVAPSLEKERVVVAWPRASFIVARDPSWQIAKTAPVRLDEVNAAFTAGGLSIRGALLRSVLPERAIAAFLGDEPRGMRTLGIAIYVVYDEIAALVETFRHAGRAMLEAIACSFEEDRSHRNAWAFEVDEIGPDTRVRMTLPVSGGDYGWQDRVDVRLRRMGGATVAIACMYEPGGDPDLDAVRCAKVVASAAGISHAP